MFSMIFWMSRMMIFHADPGVLQASSPLFGRQVVPGAAAAFVAQRFVLPAPAKLGYGRDDRPPPGSGS